MKNKIYTRKQVAYIVGVSVRQLKEWAKHQDGFILPQPTYLPVTRRTFIALLAYCRNGPPLRRVPRPLKSQKQLLAHFRVSRHILKQWNTAGLPRYVFTPRCVRYEIREVTEWLSENNFSTKEHTP